MGSLLTWLLRGTLLLLVAWSAAHPDLPQFHGKAMLARQLSFPISMLVVPAAWWLVWRHRGRGHPHVLEWLVMSPFVIDLAANTWTIYIDHEYADDVIHAVNPLLLVAAIAAACCWTGASRVVAWLLAFGLGNTGHVMFELIEYRLVEAGQTQLGLTLADTLSDLGWGIVGAALGALVGVLATRPRP